MASQYDAASIEVLSGLEPVRKRPGMYTQTERPNHLAQEVIDNSVDEAIAGYATEIDVILSKDGSVQVSDDGRGMPVDIHPKEGIPGVEVILTKLHAGGKFSGKNYEFSGGLHGVGENVPLVIHDEPLGVGRADIQSDGVGHVQASCRTAVSPAIMLSRANRAAPSAPM